MAVAKKSSSAATTTKKATTATASKINKTTKTTKPTVRAAKAAPRKTEVKKTTTARSATTKLPSKSKLVCGSIFPEEKLDQWLNGHHTWDHNDWISLLHDLEEEGFGKLVATQEGRDLVGRYLEQHRH